MLSGRRRNGDRVVADGPCSWGEWPLQIGSEVAFESLEGDKTCTMNRGAPRTRVVSQEAAWHPQEMAGRLVSIKMCIRWCGKGHLMQGSV